MLLLPSMAHRSNSHGSRTSSRATSAPDSRIALRVLTSICNGTVSDITDSLNSFTRGNPLPALWPTCWPKPPFQVRSELEYRLRLEARQERGGGVEQDSAGFNLARALEQTSLSHATVRRDNCNQPA